jgi:general secretion pathway protein J
MLGNRPHQARSQRERGFTLIELLVSLTLLSVILGILAGAMRVLSQNWEANTQRIETLDMVARASDILRRDAAGIQRVAVLKERTPYFLFTGTGSTLSFVTLEPPYPDDDGPFFVRYSVEKDGADADLIRARVRYRDGMTTFTGASGANRVRLIEGRYRYHFAYADKSAGSGDWTTSWSSTTRLPQLIRLQIFDAQHNAAVAPPLVVALRADAEIGCLSGKSKLCSAKTSGTLTAQDAAPGDEITAEDKYGR